MIRALTITAALIVAPPPTDPTLVAEASTWCRTIATSGVLAHDPNLAANPRPDWQLLGENVGRGPSVALVLAAFEASPTHHAVLHGRWDRFGFATCVARDGRFVCVQRFQLDRRTKK